MTLLCQPLQLILIATLLILNNVPVSKGDENSTALDSGQTNPTSISGEQESSVEIMESTTESQESTSTETIMLLPSKQTVPDTIVIESAESATESQESASTESIMAEPSVAPVESAESTTETRGSASTESIVADPSVDIVKSAESTTETLEPISTESIMLLGSTEALPDITNLAPTEAETESSTSSPTLPPISHEDEDSEEEDSTEQASTVKYRSHTPKPGYPRDQARTQGPLKDDLNGRPDAVRGNANMCLGAWMSSFMSLVIGFSFAKFLY